MMSAQENKSGLSKKFNNAVLLVVDVQKLFADSKVGNGTRHTEIVGKKIGRLIPAFRDAGMKIYGLYWWSANNDNIDYYGFKPDAGKGDRTIVKRTQSAFESSDLAQRLKEDGITDIYICGFNKHACVGLTALDAVDIKIAKGNYKVHLISDLSAIGLTSSCPTSAARRARGKQAEKQMQKQKIEIVRSKDLIGR